MVLDVGLVVLERAIGVEIDACRSSYLLQAHSLTTCLLFTPSDDFATPKNEGLFVEMGNRKIPWLSCGIRKLSLNRLYNTTSL